MRACVIHKAGDLRVEEWDPGLPGPGEILVAATLGGSRSMREAVRPFT